jgi:hypothetical protein
MPHKQPIVFDDDNPEWTEAVFPTLRRSARLPSSPLFDIVGFLKRLALQKCDCAQDLQFFSKTGNVSPFSL